MHTSFTEILISKGLCDSTETIMFEETENACFGLDHLR